MTEGNAIVRRALGRAREDANYNRLHGLPDNTFVRGMHVGKIIVAQFHMGADPLLVAAADNEIRFLRWYTERS